MVFAILQNHIGHLFRQLHAAKREPALQADSRALEQVAAPGADPADEATRRDEVRALLHRVEQLPERYRDVLRRVTRGDNTATIAQDLSLSPGAVRQQRARAVKALRTA